METGTSSAEIPNKHKKLRLAISPSWPLLFISWLVIVAITVSICRPWNRFGANDRTIQVTGETTVKATPDQYVFSPSYTFTNTDQQQSLNQASQKSTDVVNGLKKLGVKDSQIKTSTTSYADYVVSGTASKDQTYYLVVTITADSRELAQKVQDYLLTTSPQGAITPVASFSQSMQKKLETEARDAATKDAKSKAAQSAKNLEFKVGPVKSVQDGTGFDGRVFANAVAPTSGTTAIKDNSTSQTIQPGENELSYNLTVTYFVR
jgi:uncharacterized protein YggE